MPYSDPEKSRECRRRYKLSVRGKLLAKKWRQMKVSTDPEFVVRARAAERRYCARNPEKIRIKNSKGRVTHAISIRNSRLKILYGITQADYDRMLLEQKGCCAICGTSNPGRGNKHFSVDHDHRTNKVRQLLCDLCNNGLGRFRDDPKLMIKAIEYLLKHAGGA